MKQDYICVVCNKIAGRGHGFEQGKILSKHMRSLHPVEYQEISDVNTAIEAIESKYKIYTRDFFYFRPLTD